MEIYKIYTTYTCIITLNSMMNRRLIFLVEIVVKVTYEKEIERDIFHP